MKFRDLFLKMRKTNHYDNYERDSTFSIHIVMVKCDYVYFIKGFFRMEHVNSTPPARPLLEMKGIAKRFGTFYALQDVDLSIYRGEIHALMGKMGRVKVP